MRMFWSVVILGCAYGSSWIVCDYSEKAGLVLMIPIGAVYGWLLAQVWWPSVRRSMMETAAAKARAVPGRKRERLLWIGDGMAPAGAHLHGCPVVVNGRTGVVVDSTALTITVEWLD